MTTDTNDDRWFLGVCRHRVVRLRIDACLIIQNWTFGSKRSFSCLLPGVSSLLTPVWGGEAGGIWGSRLVSDAPLGCSFTLSLFSSHPALLISGFLSGVNLKTRLKSDWSLAQTSSTTDPAKVGSVLSRSSGSVFSPLTDLAREDIKVVILPPCRCRGYLLVISAAYHGAHTSRLY